MVKRIIPSLACLVALVACCSAHALWSPAWQVSIVDALDTGGTVYRDSFVLGAGGNGVDGYSLIDDVRKVHLIGWPDAGYTGPAVKAIGISSTVSAVELGKDARAAAALITWNIDLKATATMSGTENLAWTLTSVPSDKGLTLKDFGSDSTRNALVASTDMKSVGSYSFASTKTASSTRYMQVIFGGAAPAPELSIRSVSGNPVVSWQGVTGTNYRILSTENMKTGWNVETTMTGVAGPMQWTDMNTSGVAKKFYKVETN